MERSYIICWRTKDNERSGQGKKLFTREEAEALADELNHEYPNFTHEAIHQAAANLCNSPIVPDASDADDESAEMDEENEVEQLEEEEEEEEAVTA